MNRRRIIWSGFALFILVFFYALIPVDVYEAHDMLLSFLGAALFAVTLAQAIGDFDSIQELLDKDTFRETAEWTKKYFWVSVFPAIILIFVLVIHQSNRKEDELKKHGILTKGTVVNGSSTTTRRRLQSSTTYDLIVAYRDSSGREHNVHYNASSHEFKNAYRGQQVDFVYSRLHPGLGTPLLSLDKLAQYAPIANQKIAIGHLLAILESNRQDTILNFLNKINYQWTNEGDTYANEKRNLAIKILIPQSEIAYIEPQTFPVQRLDKSENFEQSLVSSGFKKKALTIGDKTEELYYNETYSVSKEQKVSKQEEGFGLSLYTIYHVFINSTK